MNTLNTQNTSFLEEFLRGIAHKCDKKMDDLCADDLKNELSLKNEDGTPKYQLGFKEDPNYILIFYNDVQPDYNRDPNIINFENNCKSLLLRKSDLKPICSQFKRIMYNDDALRFLSNKKWDSLIIQECIEGTYLIVFFDDITNKWIITTRRCMNATESLWVRGKSYYTMFMESIEGRLKLNDLDKDLCYHFVLVHHLNKNIVTFKDFRREYKEVFHIMTNKKWTLEEVNVVINSIRVPKTCNFKNINDLKKEISNIDKADKGNSQITTEGFVLKFYNGKPHMSSFETLKLQTGIYQFIASIKPNNNNIHQNYLELYQKDKLQQFLPFFAKFNNDVMPRINVSMKTLAKELLDLYYLTRSHTNPQIYEGLTSCYKQAIYQIHGAYIQQKKNNGLVKSVAVHDVYHYIKLLPFNDLRQLFFDRTILSKLPAMTFINNNCIEISTLCALMFKNYGDEHVKNKNKNKNDETTVNNE